MDKNGKSRHSVWLTDDVWQEVDALYKLDTMGGIRRPTSHWYSKKSSVPSRTSSSVRQKRSVSLRQCRQVQMQNRIGDGV